MVSIFQSKPEDIKYIGWLEKYNPIRRYVQQWKDWLEITAVKLVNETDGLCKSNQTNYVLLDNDYFIIIASRALDLSMFSLYEIESNNLTL